jgi:hypothetical protein
MDLALDLVFWAIFRVIESQKELTFSPRFLVLNPKLSFEALEMSF